MESDYSKGQRLLHYLNRPAPIAVNEDDERIKQLAKELGETQYERDTLRKDLAAIRLEHKNCWWDRIRVE